VSVVKTHEGIDEDRILLEQGKDKYCSTLRPGTFSSKTEYFYVSDGVIYRRVKCGNHQVMIPRSLRHELIREHHEPKFISHPGVHRTHALITLRHWWPGMQRTIREYFNNCEACQRRKGAWQFTAPLGDVDEPRFPFEVTAIDITGPYVETPRKNKYLLTWKNKYLLTFIDHFSRYMEAIPIPDQSAETCARVYASQIIARHGTGSKLITDQGWNFMLKFFEQTCKI
jgi:hypothetical protein